MKAWFAKLRISAALDDGQGPAAGAQREKCVSTELRGFAQELTALDRALKQTVPKPDAPPSLHSSIMRAVRAAEHPAAEPGRELTFVRWVPWSVAAVAAVIAVWYVSHGPERLPARDAQSLAVATTALEMGGQVTRAAPAAVVTPLADELARVNRDLDSTAQFLLASLP
jgi:hypothetical protein